MIPVAVVELLIGGATVVVSSAIWAGVWLTNKIHERENPPEPYVPPPTDPREEERLVLERSRSEWLRSADERMKNYGERDEHAVAEIDRIDKQLIELARRQ